MKGSNIRIHLLGTCGGIEPIANMKHSSFALEIDGYFYIFDAGEGCSRTAYFNGVDLLKIRAIFITHPHMDHVGGLHGLLWNIRKLTTRSDLRPYDNRLEVFMPDMDSWEAILGMLRATEGNFKCDFDINTHRVLEGKIYEDDLVKVHAWSNNHIADGKNRSFTYSVECADKKIVFSGDVKNVTETEGAVGEGCDLLLMETGHHSMETVIEYVNKKNIKKLVFVHHGRYIIENREEAKGKLKLCNKPALLGHDKMIVDLMEG